MSNSIGPNGSLLPFVRVGDSLNSVVGAGDSLKIAGCIPTFENRNQVHVGSLGTIQFGANGAEVKLLRRALVALEYLKNFEDVGYFDEDVQHAVEAFQRHESLEVDGVVGPQTWETLSLRVSSLTTLANDPYIHCLPRIRN